jgi:hypothetical protein
MSHLGRHSWWEWDFGLLASIFGGSRPWLDSISYLKASFSVLSRAQALARRRRRRCLWESEQRNELIRAELDASSDCTAVA